MISRAWSQILQETYDYDQTALVCIKHKVSYCVFSDQVTIKTKLLQFELKNSSDTKKSETCPEPCTAYLPVSCV